MGGGNEYKMKTAPTEALLALPALDRLDLSHNHLETLTTSSFKVRGSVSTTSMKGKLKVKMALCTS
jgi:Leucine-rich repeat (LRR) protein